MLLYCKTDWNKLSLGASCHNGYLLLSFSYTVPALCRHVLEATYFSLFYNTTTYKFIQIYLFITELFHKKNKARIKKK